MESFLQDLRFALRSFGRSPGFLLGSVLTLTLVIAANTALFSVTYGVLLKPLPFPQPDRLVELWEKNPEKDWMFQNVAPANFLDWRLQSEVFEDITAYESVLRDISLTGDGVPQALKGVGVFGNFFSVIGVQPILGRGFSEEESWTPQDQVVVLSHGLWQRQFGADPQIAGKKLFLEEREYIILGVMPPRFSFPYEDLDIWVSVGWQPELTQADFFRRSHFMLSIARLRPGVSLDRARSNLEAIAAGLEKQYPDTNRLMGAGLTPLHEWIVGDIRLPLLIVQGTVFLVLLIACANIASLQLARGIARKRELTLRSVLGASRGRLVRQLLTESLLLALLGGMAGFVLGLWGNRLLISWNPGDLPRADEIAPDWTVLWFTLGATLLAALLFGLVPAIQLIRASGSSALNEEGRQSTESPRTQWMRSALVVSEIALVVVLTTGAALLLKSFSLLSNVDPGFQSKNVLTAKVMLTPWDFPTAVKTFSFQRELLERIRSLPGVQSAALTDSLPLTGLYFTGDFSIKGRPPDEYGVEIHKRIVSPGYFRTVGVPLKRGRFFADADTRDVPRVILINEALARRFFPNEDPIGKQMVRGREPEEDATWQTIVGVVCNERLEGLDVEPRPEIFEVYTQSATLLTRLVVRTSTSDPSVLVGSIQRELSALDASLPLFEVQPLEEIVSRAVARQRFLMILMGIFAGIALVLAVLGAFALISFRVVQQTKEIGIRMALGAARGQVLRMVIGRAMLLVLLGIGLGLGGALALGGILSSLLFRVSSMDPATLVIVVSSLILVTLLSSFIPARRAATIDPNIALRQD